MVADKNSIKSIEKLVNAFLELGKETDKKFADLFNVEPYFNEDLAEEYYNEGWWKDKSDRWNRFDFKSYTIDPDKPWENLTYDEKLLWARAFGDPEDDNRGPLVGAGLVFTAKSPEYEKFAKILENIENIYEPEIYSN